jgi:hypothetical protein
MIEAGTENGGAIAGVPVSAADIPVSTSSGTSVEDAAVNDRSEDLTVFFSIGVIIDVLLVAAFLVWAIGQWRKTKK